MIPDNTLTRALNTYHGLNRTSWTLYAPEETIRMREILEDVAADIWDQGWRAGSLDVTHRYAPETPNPYLASEDE